MDNSILTGKQVIIELLSKAPSKIEKIWIQKHRHKDVKKILELCQNNKVKYQFVPREKLDSITRGRHQGFVAKVFSPGFLETSEILSLLGKARLPIILALDQIQDQGNIGVIARTLYSLGGVGLVIPKYRSAQLGDRAFKSSSGALAHLPIARTVNLKHFLQLSQDKDLHFYYAGTDQNCADLYKADIYFPLILVLGNEEKGVRPSIKKMCHQGLTIPMHGGFDSLNVAQAGAIFMGEFLRRWLNTIQSKNS